MSELLKCIWEGHGNVMAALVWVFANVWEGGDYAQHFGLHTIDRTTKARSYKKSFFDLVDFVNVRMP